MISQKTIIIKADGSKVFFNPNKIITTCMRAGTSNTVGPALEAKEALEVLMNQKQVPDLIDKACNISGSMFELLGKKNGYSLAKKILESGKAEQKMREIIKDQGGDPDILPEDIPIGKYSLVIRSEKSGKFYGWKTGLL